MYVAALGWAALGCAGLVWSALACWIGLTTKEESCTVQGPPPSYTPRKAFPRFNVFNGAITLSYQTHSYFLQNINDFCRAGTKFLGLKHESLNEGFLPLPLRKFPCHFEDFVGTGTNFSLLFQKDAFFLTCLHRSDEKFCSLPSKNHIVLKKVGSYK